MSGQGTSLALTGAHVPAGEPAAAGGDHRAAFPAYEKELRDYARANQDIAIANMRMRRAQTVTDSEGAVATVAIAAEDFAQVVASYAVKDY